MLYPSVGGYMLKSISKRRRLYAKKVLFPSVGGYMLKNENIISNSIR